MIRGVRRAAVGVAVVGVLLGAGPAVGDSGQAAPARTRTATAGALTATAATAATSASPLTVHVSLDKHRVRIGHRLRITYTWTDGNGDLVDTNHVGTMAMHVLRNVPCARSGHAAHPIHGSGSWWYRPQPEFTGAFTHSVKIQVGFNVRTGGCAPVEEATASELVTVLPAGD